ncbi:hypothetical protein G7Z17_g9696 [Cylindrodendrum hubeiense]|uniref:PHD-type domain-containing protein n=1 Tax=Cylindrodendrum hubeiense TaxID=595255 RepID=A0A9P5H7C4_9HYPO|nr:hypothetical protein G7Z17_g9696 [Cylindrodendrum hubeiense]
MANRPAEKMQSESTESFEHSGCIEIPSTEEPSASTLTQSQQTSYVSQFSATNSLILNRLKPNPRGTGSAASSTQFYAYHSDKAIAEGNGSRPPQNMSDALTMPMPASPATHQPSNWNFLNSGAKRKRDASTDVDFTQNTISFPWVDQPKSLPSEVQTQPGEPHPRNCSKCDKQSRTPEDTLVECNRCLKFWHQRCHSPAVTNETVKLLSFMCDTCTAEQEQAVRLKGKVNHQRRDEIERLRQKRLAVLPLGVVPAKSKLIGFGAGRAPDSSRNEYFSHMKKTDLLNILSLCDQLKPQLLTDILVSVSKRHPDLPIFDSPDWETELPSSQRPAKGSKGDERPRHGHVIQNGKARLKAKATKKILKRTRVIEVVTDMPGEDEDVLPPTWVKADEGMYAKLLLPDTEDKGFLLDENDEESFSHFLVDSFGKQIVEAVGG